MLRLLIFCVLLTCSAQASAQLAIDRLWVDLDDSGAGRSDLVVRNESDDIYYITVTPAEITAPGTDAQKRETHADPEELGLLVTPNRLVLRPEEMRAIRIVSLNQDLETDRVYRVNITPQIGEISYDQEAVENRGLALKLLAAFDVLVTVGNFANLRWVRFRDAVLAHDRRRGVELGRARGKQQRARCDRHRRPEPDDLRGARGHFAGSHVPRQRHLSPVQGPGDSGRCTLFRPDSLVR